MEEVGFTSHVVGALGDIGFPIDNHSVAGQSENTLSLSEKYLILTIFLLRAGHSLSWMLLMILSASLPWSSSCSFG